MLLAVMCSCENEQKADAKDVDEYYGNQGLLQ